jgi:hypothetical protein
MVPWPQVITGVVGVVGIAGTIVSGRLAARSATKDLKLSIAAEDRRAQIAEKRRVYAHTLTVIAELGAAMSSYRADFLSASGPRQAELSRNQYRLVITSWQAVNELKLVAPDKPVEVVNKLMTGWMDYLDVSDAIVRGEGPGPGSPPEQELDEELTRGQIALLAAMRADLDESA